MLIEWRHDICADISRKRYIEKESIPTVHEEIANLFFPPESEESDDSSEGSNKSSKFIHS